MIRQKKVILQGPIKRKSLEDDSIIITFAFPIKMEEIQLYLSDILNYFELRISQIFIAIFINHWGQSLTNL